MQDQEAAFDDAVDEFARTGLRLAYVFSEDLIQEDPLAMRVWSHREIHDFNSLRSPVASVSLLLAVAFGYGTDPQRVAALNELRSRVEENFRTDAAGQVAELAREGVAL